MPRGFGGMSKERQREYASRGGKAVHARGTAYKWTKGTVAREAGRKGGLASAKARQRLQKLAREQGK